MQLPILYNISQLVTQWKGILDPVIANNLNDVSILSDITLASGVNTINHLLGKKQQGWFIVDKQAVADIYRSAPFNDKTLVLTSSANVVVSIGVF